MARWLVFILLLMPVAWAKSPELPHKSLAHLAQACTSDGAFGHRFDEAGHGHIDSIADEEWAPFRRLTLSAQAGYRIIAEASFRDTTESHEKDVAAARRFFHALDKAITAKHRFAHREAHAGGITFHTGDEPDAGLIFDLRREWDRVTAECVDLGD